MKIAFYAPLKSPLHAVPSGDRLMARLLFRALELGGHTVELVSELRAFAASPGPRTVLEGQAKIERARLSKLWRETGKPDLWFCYHLYYKAPDLLGPQLCLEFGIPYVTVEASYSARRDRQGWADDQALVRAAIRQAALNICMTARDRQGLHEAEPEAATALLPPFIDATDFAARKPQPVPGRLLTVAMMRPGDKLESYRFLAAALARVQGDWHLKIIGDGPVRSEVEALFAGLPSERVVFAGALPPDGVARELSEGSLFVWPGCGEAYGLAYLEALASGLPVVALETAGVPEVVQSGRGGMLVRDGDIAAYSQAIAILLSDRPLRDRLSADARDFVLSERALPAAAARLSTLLQPLQRNA